MKKYHKQIKIAAIALLAYALTGFFIFPFALRYFAEKTLREQVSEQASIAKVRANPFTLELRVEGFQLPDPAGIWAVGFERATVNLSAMTLLKFYPVLDLVRLESPEIDFLRRRAAAPSATPELATAEPEPTAAAADTSAPQSLEELAALLNTYEIPKLRIHLLEVVNGNLDFRDETNPTHFTESINPMNFTLENFTTVVDASGDNTMYFLAKTPAGTELEWSGRLSSHPLATNGTLRISGVRIDSFSPYFAQYLRFDLMRAVYGMQLDYSINFGDLDQFFQISNGHIELSEVLCHPNGAQQQFFALDSARIDGLSFGYPAMAAEIDEISIRAGYTRAVRNRAGEINLLNLIALPAVDEAASAATPAATTTTAPFAPTAQPSLKVHVIQIDDYRMLWQDDSLAQPAELELRLPSFRLENVSTDLNEPVQVAFTYLIGEQGRVHSAGQVTPASGQAEFSIEIETLPLDFANAYAQELAQAQVQSGSFSFSGQLQGNLAEGYRLSGSGAVPDFALHMDGPNQLDAAWQRFEFQQLEVRNQPLGLKLDAVRLQTPKIYLARVSEPAPSTAAPAPQPAPADQAAPADPTAVAPPLELALDIASFVLDSGSIHISDQVVEPRFDFAIEALQTELLQINLGQATPTSFKVQAEVNHSPFEMSGTLFPADPKIRTQLSLQLKELALPVFSPYSGQAVGRKLGQGWFTLNTEVKVEAGELDARNQIVIDQMELGERVDSPDALRLPLGLAISLLKGPNGVMDLSLPLSGDLYDPNIGLGQIIRTAIVGLITNVAAAPFKMLSNLVGADEDISQVAFAPGSAALSPESIRKLATLAQALQKRPQLRVQTVPSLSQDDLLLLASAQLRAQLLAESEKQDDKTYLKVLRKAYKAKVKAHSPWPYPLPEDPARAVSHMKAVLLSEVAAGDPPAQALLQQRQSLIREQLVASGIAAERVQFGSPDLEQNRARVAFELE